MKKILSLALILMMVLSMFLLAACGSKNIDENMTSMSEELSTDMSELDDNLTQNGNISDTSESDEAASDENDQTTDEGILGDITDEMTSTTSGTEVSE